MGFSKAIQRNGINFEKTASTLIALAIKHTVFKGGWVKNDPNPEWGVIIQTTTHRGVVFVRPKVAAPHR